MDDLVIDLTGSVVEKYHRHEIGDLIAHTVAGWDPEATVAKVRAGGGTGLQFVRINGTIVGGLVGLRSTRSLGSGLNPTCGRFVHPGHRDGAYTNRTPGMPATTTRCTWDRRPAGPPDPLFPHARSSPFANRSAAIRSSHTVYHTKTSAARPST